MKTEKNQQPKFGFINYTQKQEKMKQRETEGRPFETRGQPFETRGRPF